MAAATTSKALVRFTFCDHRFSTPYASRCSELKLINWSTRLNRNKYVNAPPPYRSGANIRFNKVRKVRFYLDWLNIFAYTIRLSSIYFYIYFAFSCITSLYSLDSYKIQHRNIRDQQLRYYRQSPTPTLSLILFQA